MKVGLSNWIYLVRILKWYSYILKTLFKRKINLSVKELYFLLNS